MNFPNKNQFLLKISKLLILFSLLSCFSKLHALTISQFYKADFLSGIPSEDQRNLVSSLSIRYAYGSTSQGYGLHKNRKTNILQIYGNTNVNTLAENVEGINPLTTPVAYQYFNPINGIIPSFNFTGNNGVIALKGKFKMNELDFDFQQNLFSGFYAYFYVPIKWLTVNDIKIINYTSPYNPNAAAFQDFLNNDFETVLAEFGLKPATKPFHKVGLGDVAIYLGWQGYSNTVINSIFRDISGSFQIGLFLPTSNTNKSDRVVSLSTGFDGCWGFTARAQGEAAFKKYAVIGLYGGVDIPQNRDLSMHLRSNLHQEGLIFLQKVSVHQTLGSAWQVGGYIKFDRIKKGLSLFFGYSFDTQERTKITVHDREFLQTFIEQEKLAKVPEAITRDSMVRNDPRLREWNQQSFHFILDYDFRDHIRGNYYPKLSFYLDYPVMGHLSWTTTLIGAGATVRAHWQF